MIHTIFRTFRQMSLMGRIVSLFPIIHFLSISWFFVSLVQSPSIFKTIVLLAVIYGLPLFCFHIHSLFYPLKEGDYNLASPQYVPWWGAYCFQMTFYTFPTLERILILFPGVFAAWLRLWGAKVGKQVHFTPRLELLDRTHLTIGDRVIFGAEVGLSQHVIRPKNGVLLLTVAKIVIGDDVLIGAESRIPPGAHIESGVMIPYGKVLHMGQTVGRDNANNSGT